MKKSLLLFIFLGLLSSSHLSAQELDQRLYDLNRLRLKRAKTAMWVLGGWGIGNIAVSGALIGSSEGSTFYFHQMNIFWNVVNVGIAGLALYGSYRADPGQYDLYETLRQQQNMEKTLLVNIPLNVAYMATGLYLIAHSKNVENNPERLEGYGQSLILQGGFLFLFDIGQYLSHHFGAKKPIREIFDHLEYTGNSIGFRYRF